MLRTHKARLMSDRVQWQGESPNRTDPVNVYITVLEPACTSAPLEDGGRQMADALRRIAERGGLSELPDAAEWQREIRLDRPLPGREG